MQTIGQFGLNHLWAQADFIIKAVAAILLLMSVSSWYLILVRSVRQFRARRNNAVVESFWTANSINDGLRLLSKKAPNSPFEALAHQGAAASEHIRRQREQNTLGAHFNPEEFVTRAMRKSIALSTAQLESGLTVLASIGSTAPFVGLFGTVWGIYHALISISLSGMATLDKVAGPVGEALIMTAFGLFVAIPAVLAFNSFTRSNRLELSALDAFAHDLHAWFTTGSRLSAAPNGSRSGSSARNNSGKAVVTGIQGAL